MRSPCPALLVMVLVLSGCVKRAPDGTVLRRIPRCEKQGRSITSRPLEDSVSWCLRLLASEPVDSSRSLLGLTTDAQGRVASVCLAGSTHEPDSRFLNCVVDQLERTSVVFPPGQDFVWTLHASY